MSKPNIVMILTDDHAAHSISAYGSRVNQTPNIDRIAHAGRRLDRCFVTNSICTPSRAAILTGTYSHVNGVYGLQTPIMASQPTFVSALHESGYRTAIFGKWHMGGRAWPQSRALRSVGGAAGSGNVLRSYIHHARG